MKYNLYILVVLLLTALLAAPASGTQTEPHREQHEWQIKAAFLYNMINFVDWPEEKTPQNDDPFIIGIVGNDDVIKAFEPIKTKKVRGKRIEIRRIDHFVAPEDPKNNDAARQKYIDSVRQCHILFLSKSAPELACKIHELISDMKQTPVLLVGEKDCFLKNGGHIRFLEENKKIRFEINLDTVKASKLKIRSKLLKLAKRVIQKDDKQQKASTQ